MQLINGGKTITWGLAKWAGVFDALGMIDDDEVLEYGDDLESDDYLTRILMAISWVMVVQVVSLWLLFIPTVKVKVIYRIVMSSSKDDV